MKDLLLKQQILLQRKEVKYGMIVEFLDKPIMVNGKPFIQDLRLNIPGEGRKQCRLKFKYIEEGKLIPVDLVVIQYTKPCIEKLSIGLSLRGEEILKKLKFDLRISYHMLGSKWNIRGTFGAHVINKELSNVTEILSVIKGLI